ncbi:hypothetical protein K3495_g11385 [Podosphaera aphanis]|nr:hypothetical protein K3495_g11385 [Podosphaera aphanis]
MSEYWKSTPRYWCKHCKTFVRDTKLETANHNATPKHQGNLKRFLRDLHRNNEKSEKDKDRAKSEVARLNGLISQTRSGEEVKSSSVGPRHGALPEVKATESQRKQNLLQLAEMGINIPSEARPSMAMAGEWEVVSERIIEEDKQGNNSESISIGVRKRKPAEGEEEEEEMLETHKKRWGSTYKVPKQDDDEDLDNLLSNSNLNLKRKIQNIKSETMEEMSQDKKTASSSREDHIPDDLKSVSIKSEPSESWDKLSEVSKNEQPDKPEIPAAIPTATFKKRKTKNIRQKK